MNQDLKLIKSVSEFTKDNSLEVRNSRQKSLIKSITSSDDLQKLAKKLHIHIDGVLDFQNIINPLSKENAYIILLRQSSGIGHWVGVYNDEYFDSMGVGPPIILGLKRYSKVQYQGAYNEYCGIWVLLWLYCKQNDRMEIMNQFENLDVDLSSYNVYSGLPKTAFVVKRR
jgi:hypothetical protein